MSLDDNLDFRELGRGRSGVVYRDQDTYGKSIARKIFTGDDITKLAHYIFSGAPNPYIWNEEAILTAHYRREVLTDLVEYWFGPKLRVAPSLGIQWNDEFQAYELQTEFIKGRPAALHHPFSGEREGELDDLVNGVMKPLQEKLIESGFDGLVWQAGKGNPVASNNFLLEDTGKNQNTWAWIDLESGVPMPAPLNPIPFFTFYLPKSIKHRHALFDDVDVDKLHAYVDVHQDDLMNKLGDDKYLILIENIHNLENHQRKWKSMRRVDRSITYQLKKGGITPAQAAWFSQHPSMWYGREIGRGAWKSYNNYYWAIYLGRYFVGQWKLTIEN